MLPLACRMKNFIQPFERHLALDELRALSSADIVPVDGDESTALTFVVPGSSDADWLRRELSYWHSVGDGTEQFTVQLRREATSIIARNGVALGELSANVSRLIPSKLPNKRCLRYATHGLHEYRGKFFPQLVRALLNSARIPTEAVVLDPMCGSGTTLVEACLSGRAALGLDMNPLSVFVSKVKCQSLNLTPGQLVKAYELIDRYLRKRVPKASKQGYFASLCDRDQEYLGKWFAESTLAELDLIQAAIRQLPTIELQDFFAVCLSNVLRGVSWQKEDDLRVRKEVRALDEGQAINRFLGEAMRSTKTVVAFLSEKGIGELGRHSVLEADARNTATELSSFVGCVDVAITSPPYATALPYLDTDRLSLIYLGLLPREDHRRRDIMMIGNREISERDRVSYWAVYESKRQSLPKATRSLIDRIDRLNKKDEVGFRRRNLSALLSKYFLDMQKVLLQQHAMLKPSGLMHIVVGNNRTTAGGEVISIETAKHLSLQAEQIGFTVANSLDMEMLASRDIFRKNAMPSEQIVTLQKCQ